MIHRIGGGNSLEVMNFLPAAGLGFPRTCRDNQAEKMALADLHISVDWKDFPQVETRKDRVEGGDRKSWRRDASPGDFPHYRYSVSDYRTMNKHDDVMWKIRIVTVS